MVCYTFIKQHAMLRLILFSVVIAAATASSAQKGAPEKQIVNIAHSTNYAQHVDFSPAMLKQLKAYPGFNVSIAASGLGKPRVLCLLSPTQLLFRAVMQATSYYLLMWTAITVLMN
jgi:hypothetical protein